MKPEQFIREFGLGKAKEVVAKNQFVADLCLITPSGKLIYYKKVKGSFPEVTDFGKVELTSDDYFMLELSDLKRLVEFMDRVTKRGGLSKTKDHLDYLISFGSEFAGVSKEEIKELQQDIAAYESIYGGGDETI